MNPYFERALGERKLASITFSAPMVRALLRPEHPKTRTRRILPQLGWCRWDGTRDEDGWPMGRECELTRDADGNLINSAINVGAHRRYPGKYSTAGQIFYVQEPLVKKEQNKSGSRAVASYSATGEIVLTSAGEPLPWRWEVSALIPRYCPAEAARLRLERLFARGEFLQELTEEEARAEGVEADDISQTGVPCYSARQRFSQLWNGLHKLPGEMWEADPAVLVVGFTQWERRAAGVAP